MSNYIVSDVSLSNVANAIRTKGGTTGQLAYPSGFVDAIGAIQSDGGGFPDDGKTYLRIKIAELGRMNVPLCFSQTVANGVMIDWGDGSTVQTLSGTGYISSTHTYSSTGEYDISLTVAAGCILTLGANSQSKNVMGDIYGLGGIYGIMLKTVRLGTNTDQIGYYSFALCRGLSNIVLPNSITSIGQNAFYCCYNLSSIVIPGSVLEIKTYSFSVCYNLSSIVIESGVSRIGIRAFSGCSGLSTITIPGSITTIESYAFDSCSGVAEYHIMSTTPPTLVASNVFNGIPSDCVIYVPAASLAEYQVATNWATYASRMVGE